MHHDYDPTATEAKWQKRWDAKGVYRADLRAAKNPYYSMVMFPYPSGDKLHVGHWYNFAPADSHARFMRMHGKDVFAPMGFDAFGLPAENYAIKTGVPPAKSIAKNVETMIAQLKRIGCMYDWEKMVNTSDPQYYKWTQWLFLQMYKHKLSYKKEAPVNWCPSCQTVLANEQAQDGTCERCGTAVEQKLLTQWFWKITDYSQRLLDGLQDLDWPEKTKTMQRNWIGRKEGIEITYPVKNSKTTVTVFTTRPETNFGATFVVISPEHPDLLAITTPDCRKNVERYVAEARKKSTSARDAVDREKTGAFTGSYAVNALNGREMPIWVADYVLMGFGTGVVVGVPGHDMRDFEFAQAMHLPVERVIKSADGDTGPIDSAEKVFEDEGELINSQFLDGLHPHAAIPRMMDHMEKNRMGKRKITYRLHDWLVSRQRYWGAPIPIVYDPEGNAHPVPEEHLPWLLPTDVEFKPTGKSPLTESKEFIARTEKIFGKGWRPEFDTMDTFVCSSFYFLRYLVPPEERGVDHTPKTKKAAPKNSKLKTKNPVAVQKTTKGDAHAAHIVDPHIEKNWMPVDMYIGGPEHACMHLIYARFVMMALKDFGFVSHSEPFKKLVHQGLITNKGAKMSKSKGNVVSPDAFIDYHGSDVFRMYLMFMGPFTEGGDWSDTGIKGIDRFVQRLWRAYTLYGESLKSKTEPKKSPDQMQMLHRTIKKVTEEITALRFNTAISALMEMLNNIESGGTMYGEVAHTLPLLLSPLAPHMAEELWEMVGGKGFVIDQKWPAYDAAQLKSDTMKIAVQVNGKLRGEVTVATDAAEADILAAARTEENVMKFLEGKKPKKEIYVKGRLVNLVV